MITIKRSFLSDTEESDATNAYLLHPYSDNFSLTKISCIKNKEKLYNTIENISNIIITNNNKHCIHNPIINSLEFIIENTLEEKLDISNTLKKILFLPQDNEIIGKIIFYYGRGPTNPPTSLGLISFNNAWEPSSNINLRSILHKFTNVTQHLTITTARQVENIKSTIRNINVRSVNETFLKKYILGIDPKKMSKINNIDHLNFKLKTNQIKISQYLKTLGTKFDIRGMQKIDNFYNLKISKMFPEANDFQIKKLSVDLKKNIKLEDVLSAEKLKKSKNYPYNSNLIHKELATNKSIKQIEKAVIQKINKSSLSRIKTKFFTYTAIGGVAVGFFKFVIQPWLLESGGCHYNICDDSIPTKRRSQKILEFSCNNKNTSLYTIIKKHPFYDEIINWENNNNEGDCISYDYNGHPIANDGVVAFVHCSNKDVEAYGPCGGWGTPKPGYPLTTKFNLSNLEPGTSISCDETPEIFEAITDVAVSAGVNIVEIAGNVLSEIFPVNIFLCVSVAIFLIFFFPYIYKFFPLPRVISHR